MGDAMVTYETDTGVTIEPDGSVTRSKRSTTNTQQNRYTEYVGGGDTGVGFCSVAFRVHGRKNDSIRTPEATS